MPILNFFVWVSNEIDVGLLVYIFEFQNCHSRGPKWARIFIDRKFLIGYLDRAGNLEKKCFGRFLKFSFIFL